MMMLSRILPIKVAFFVVLVFKIGCRTELGQQYALGNINPDRLNMDGGALSQGHPVGASGTRIVLHLAHILQRHQAKYGIASLCIIGGGQGGAMLLEGGSHHVN